MDARRRTRGSASLLWGLSSVDCGRGDYFIFFKCDGVAIFAVMRKVLICLNALRHLESLFSIRPKATLFLKEASHRCEEAFCQLNIEVSSLQGLSEFNSSTVSTSYPQLVLASLHDALSASVRVKRSATNLPTSLCDPKGCSGRTPLQSRIAVCPFGLVLHKEFARRGIDHIPKSGQGGAFTRC